MNEMNGSGNLSGQNSPSSNGQMQNGNALPPNAQEQNRQNGQESRLNDQESNPSLLSPNEPSPADPVLNQDLLIQRDSKSAGNAWRNGSPPLNAQQPSGQPGNLLNRQDQPQPGTEQNDLEARRRKAALDLWRSLKNVNANLPEDLISDELTAASDAEDLQTKSFGDCWLRSRCPMPRLRISDGVSERLIPWYSVLEVHVDATFRLFELYLAGDVVCRIISRRPQQELYANLQLERVKVIYPVANVAVSFEDLKAKKPGPGSSGTGEH